MNKRTTMAVLVALMAAAPVGASGPYHVYRLTSLSAGVVTPDPPLATVLSPSPVIDPSLLDGISYFYLVRDASGASLDVRLTADRMAETVEVAFDGTGTLRDDAIGGSQDLFGPAGVLATMAASASGTPVAAALHEARLDGVAALDDFAANSPERDDNALHTWLDHCLRTLADAKANPSPFTVSDIEAVEERVVEIARALVNYHLELAIGLCGACNPETTQPGKVCQAQASLDEGNALRASTGTPSQVVNAYGECIRFSLLATDYCN